MSFGKPITTTSRFLVEPHTNPNWRENWEAFKRQRIPSHVLRNNSVAFCDKHDKYGVCHKCEAEKK